MQDWNSGQYVKERELDPPGRQGRGQLAPEVLKNPRNRSRYTQTEESSFQDSDLKPQRKYRRDRVKTLPVPNDTPKLTQRLSGAQRRRIKRQREREGHYQAPRSGTTRGHQNHNQGRGRRPHSPPDHTRSPDDGYRSDWDRDDALAEQLGAMSFRGDSEDSESLDSEQEDWAWWDHEYHPEGAKTPGGR